MPESTQSLAEFKHFREKMNAAILAADNLARGGSIVIPHLRRAVARLEEPPAK